MTVTYESYLCHHGVKGMKWGVRKHRMRHDEKRLNRLSNSADYKKRRSDRYSKNYNDTDASARLHTTPTQYARWYTSGARQSQLQAKKQYEHNAQVAKRKTEQYLNKMQNKYTVVYDVATGTYTLRDKKVE